MSDTRWIAELAARVQREGRAVLVTLANATGSTPREAGTAMVVSTQGVFGTIGGGHLEFEAIRLARDALAGASAPAPWLVRFPLAARLGQCCGGVATLAFSPITTADCAWLPDAVAREREGTAMDLVTVIGAARDAHAIRAASSAADCACVVTSDDATEVVHTVVPEHMPAFIDTHGLFAQRYDATPGSSYLFRPDQHLNARWRTLDVNAVRSALSRAACPHAPALATS